MTTDVDITDFSSDEARERLFGALDDLDADDELIIASEHDPDPLLALYQLQRARTLNWEIEEGDPNQTVYVESAGGLDDPIKFDVRSIPPRQRHELLTDAFDALDPKEEFVLVNDHDPKPLYYEFRSTRGDVVSWDYESKDDGEWRVVVGKTAPATEGRDDVFTAFDVRKIPKPDRHPAIHHRYGMIPEGKTMEVVAPHEPRPLHQEFRQRYSDTFEWEVVESEYGRCQVQITKTEETDGEATESTDGHASCGHHSHSHSHEHGHGHGHSHGRDDAHAHHSSQNNAGRSADDTDGAAELTITEELDVRDLPPAQRHENIFETYAGLDGGEAFVLVNDHDPKPVYHQFEAEMGDEFHWKYQQKESGEFRVLIGKGEGGSSGLSPGEQPEAPF
jgi:uncharacterized protein (DUF2249 family)